MKKKSLLILLAFIALPFLSIAHAPKKMDAAYNSDTGILKITVPHKVKNVKTHYIDAITLTIDENEIVKTYAEQSSKESHVVEIQLDKYAAGTIIDISASCNKLGSKKAQVTVE